MQGYTSLHVTVMICATMVNTQTDTRHLLTGYTISSAITRDRNARNDLGLPTNVDFSSAVKSFETNQSENLKQNKRQKMLGLFDIRKNSYN